MPSSAPASVAKPRRDSNSYSTAYSHFLFLSSPERVTRHCTATAVCVYIGKHMMGLQEILGRVSGILKKLFQFRFLFLFPVPVPVPVPIPFQFHVIFQFQFQFQFQYLFSHGCQLCRPNLLIQSQLLRRKCSKPTVRSIRSVGLLFFALFCPDWP